MAAKRGCGSVCLCVHRVCSDVCALRLHTVYLHPHWHMCRVFMEVYFPPHTFTMVCMWRPRCAGCAILFSGLPPPPPEPQILLHPSDIWNVTGKDVIFGCEVFAYPMASVEWRKDGSDIQLPGDDPHISVQVGKGAELP